MHARTAKTMVTDWAVRLAEEVAVDEIELAPAIAEAFVAGGKARRGLFARVNAQAGGFLPGDESLVLPMLFQALATVSTPLLAILGSHYTTDLLAIVKNALALVVVGKDASKAVSSPASTESVQLARVIDRLSRKLRALEMSREKRDQIVLIVLRMLLENPEDARHFIGQLAPKRR